MLLVLVAYLPALRAGFIWDDDMYVVENRALWEPGGLRRIWLQPGATPQYYPLVFTTFWLEYRLWPRPLPDRPAPGYHLTNVLLHAGNAVLVWLVLSRLAVPGAWLAAALFGLHPVHVESVAWVTERKNVLSGLFYGLSLLAFLRFAPPEPEREGGRQRWRWYVLSLALFLAALLSKTVTCSLPAVLVLLVWWKRGRVSGRDWLALLPFFALGLALAALTVHLESGHVGARGPDWDFSLAERVLIAGRALWFYAGKLAWPEPLAFFYPRWQIDAGAWWQYLFPAAAVAVPVGLFLLRRRLGRGPLVAVLFFAGTLVPALGFINVYPMLFSFVADHFQYLASIGLLALAAALVGVVGQAALPVLGRDRQGSLSYDSNSQERAPGSGLAWLLRWTGLAAAALVLVVLGALTWRQCGAYQDLETLWTDTLNKNPDAWAAHYNLAVLRLKQGRTDEAIEQFRDTLRLRPRNADAQCNLGVALAKKGRPDAARACFRAALAIKPADLRAHLNLGHLCKMEGRDEDAAGHFADARRANPDAAEPWDELGKLFARQGRWQEAAEHFEQAVKKREDVAEYHYRWAEALQALGRTEEAETQVARSRQLNPWLAPTERPWSAGP